MEDLTWSFWIIMEVGICQTCLSFKNWDQFKREQLWLEIISYSQEHPLICSILRKPINMTAPFIIVIWSTLIPTMLSSFPKEFRDHHIASLSINTHVLIFKGK
jgi:hypothetical protein